MRQVILIIGFFALTISKSFAADPVSSAVERSFQSKFALAKEVSWSQADGFTIASFVLDGKKKFAYFNQSAELVVVAEAISLNHLSIDQQASLEENFSGLTVVEAYKMKNEEGLRYYVVLENKKEKVFVTSNGGEWETVKKTKK